MMLACQLLNWQAGYPEDVAAAIDQQLDPYLSSRISAKTRRTVEKIIPIPAGGCRVIVEGSKDGGIYDAAILSIGFGYEAFLR